MVSPDLDICETPGRDSGFRRRDEFEAWCLFVIPSPYQVQGKLQPESSGIREKFDAYTIGFISNFGMSRKFRVEIATSSRNGGTPRNDTNRLVLLDSHCERSPAPGRSEAIFLLDNNLYSMISSASF